MNERKAGWYWVKLEHSTVWIPWEWIGESSLLKARWADCIEPIEVGPRIPTRDEML